MLRRKQEEEEGMKKVEGRMLNILVDIKANKTARDITVAGLNLGPVRCGLLSSNVE
jgi:hypothetical protein